MPGRNLLATKGKNLLAEPPAGPPTEQPGMLQRAGRQVGLGTRAVLEGGMDVVSPFADVLGMGLNAALPGQPFPERHSEAFSGLLTRAGLPEPQGGAEQFSNVASRIITGAAAGGLAEKAIRGATGAVPSAAQAVRTPSQTVLSRAQKEGMVVPPAQVAPKSAGAILEGMGGTLKTGQLAAAKNQPIINTLAARAVGVSDEALTPELLQSIRGQASNAYRVIRSAGEVVTDDDFIKQVANAVQPFKSTAKNFPELANDKLIRIADSLAQKSFDADAAVDAIQMLRDSASVAYRAGSNSEGAAYRSLASALEGGIERHLARQGASGSAVLKAFRDARQLIAKTHTVEDAMRGSNVDIHALSRMLKRGVPLTDELKLLGQFGQEFPGAANLTSALKQRPPYSPLDAIAATSSIGAALATGNPAVALPAAYSIGRPMARSAALSPLVQRLMTQPGVQLPAGQIAGGAASTAENARQRLMAERLQGSR